MLRLKSRGQVRGPGPADDGAGARPDHGGAAQRDEPLLRGPGPGQLQPRRLSLHRQPSAQVLSPAPEVNESRGYILKSHRITKPSITTLLYAPFFNIINYHTMSYKTLC